jgi:hypothetical protein
VEINTTLIGLVGYVLNATHVSKIQTLSHKAYLSNVVLCEFELRSRPGVLDTTLCDKVNQLLAHGRSFSPGTPASSTTKTDRHDIAEILLKVVLNTKNQRLV